ncbi:hypothetical protein ACVWZA_002705 [Sphingomonas sp. UYAg733]
MSAAAARAALASIGADLTALSGAPDDRRGNALLMRVGGVALGQATIGDLATVPVWLRGTREAHRRLALRLALLSIAPVLASSIDGRWLGAIATLAGEEMLDWAIQSADMTERADDVPHAPERIEARGFALLRSQLSPALHGYLGWAPLDDVTYRPAHDPALVASWLDAALAAEAA